MLQKDLLYGPDLNHKFDVTITPNVSSATLPDHSSMSQTAKEVQWNVSRTQPNSSCVWLAFFPGQKSVNAVSHAQPELSMEIFTHGNGPHEPLSLIL